MFKLIVCMSDTGEESDLSITFYSSVNDLLSLPRSRYSLSWSSLTAWVNDDEFCYIVVITPKKVLTYRVNYSLRPSAWMSQVAARILVSVGNLIQLHEALSFLYVSSKIDLINSTER